MMTVLDYPKIQENKKEIKTAHQLLIPTKPLKIVLGIQLKTITKRYSKKNKFKQKFRNLKMMIMNQI
jgi:hypothetical protein